MKTRKLRTPEKRILKRWAEDYPSIFASQYRGQLAVQLRKLTVQPKPNP